MRLNTEKAIQLGRKLHAKYGSWENIRKHSTYVDGVWVLKEKKDEK
jgi:hypothetical protein